MSVSVVLFYRKIGRYALNAIAGAINAHAATRGVPLVLAGDETELINAIQEANVRGDCALVGWSSYSPGFVENAELLAKIRENFRCKCCSSGRRRSYECGT